MIVLFTDFGVNGPYLGQMEAAIYQVNRTARVVNLCADAPRFNPRAAAYLLAAYATPFPAGTVFLAVVDPGVGSDRRKPVVVIADGRYFVGPDNGLFDVVARHAASAIKREILWRPNLLSPSFHGRDLFAPVAAFLEGGGIAAGWLGPEQPYAANELEVDLCEVVYIDHYGNAMTGLRAARIRANSGIRLAHRPVTLSRARTFADVARGQSFWYENSSGLVEFAVNCGSAAEHLSLTVGTAFEVLPE